MLSKFLIYRIPFACQTDLFLSTPRSSSVSEPLFTVGSIWATHICGINHPYQSKIKLGISWVEYFLNPVTGDDILPKVLHYYLPAKPCAH